MRRFEHTLENLVIVRDGASVYIDSPENFAADSGRAAPNAPGLLYVDGLPVVQAGKTVISSNPVFDAVIDQVGLLIAAQDARRLAAVPAPTPAEKLQAAYTARGVTAEKIAMAVLENDAAKLQALRDAAAAAKVEASK